MKKVVVMTITSDSLTNASRRQARASDPTASAWVSANAGSGKTHVLVNRVIRLLLTGTPPEKILCLTFTRAAAAEMSARLFQDLARWIALDDDQLIEQIHRNTGHVRLKPDQLARPRRLFALALETPGGLKIQTIHAFCEQLLQRFPVEAGITPGFAVLDDHLKHDMITRIKSQYLTAIQLEQNHNRTRHLEQILRYCSTAASFDELLENLIGKRQSLKHILESDETRAAAAQSLADYLGIDPDDTPASITARFISRLDRSQLRHVHDCYLGTGDKSRADKLAAALEADEPHILLERLSALFLKSDKNQIKQSLYCKALREKHGETAAFIDCLAELVFETINQIRSLDTMNATTALLAITGDIIARYEEEKNRLGAYDYEDLVLLARAMLEDMPGAPWVLYRLDGGIDHILVDEAQDTSAGQWRIIELLSEEFFAGESARRGVNRTIFAVGDPKQSIFGFQGAEPELFNTMKNRFQQLVSQTGQQFVHEEFEVSFRSAPEILKMTDKVFSQQVAQKGVGTPVHAARDGNLPGLVELWDLVIRDKPEKQGAFDPDRTFDTDVHQKRVLAERIASEISHWLKTGVELEARGRKVEPGDILILVRHRTVFMDALVRALKFRNIPVAGVDRLKVTRHIAVQDLMALARFVLLPEDDLNFAGLLKSSLLCRDDGTPVDDDVLIALGNDRTRISLWQAFSNQAEERLGCSRALADLKQWRAMADMMTPFMFFSQVLETGGKRAQMLSRLGSEAREPVEAFMLLALEYESTNIASLEGFLSWLQSTDIELKRDMEQPGGKVRVMTVHGAKGLEADIVILPDTCEVPDGRKMDKLLFSDEQTPVWGLKSELSSAPVRKLKERVIERNTMEYNRLLYVAMTRARFKLYVCGAASGKPKNHCWYAQIANIMKQDGRKTLNRHGETIWRFELGGTGRLKAQTGKDRDWPVERQLPDWALTPPARRPRSDTWLTPSRLAGEDIELPQPALSPVSGSEQVSPARRGILVHRLLQYLPDIEPGKRLTAAMRYLKLRAGDLAESTKKALVEEVMKVLEHKDFAAVFSAAGKAEVAFAATVDLTGKGLVRIHGRVDRLCVMDKQVLVVDYKTGQPPDDTLLPPAYAAQMAAYRLALAHIHKGHEIRCALLWTANARLQEIPAEVMDGVMSH